MLKCTCNFPFLAKIPKIVWRKIVIFPMYFSPPWGPSRNDNFLVKKEFEQASKQTHVSTQQVVVDGTQIVILGSYLYVHSFSMYTPLWWHQDIHTQSSTMYYLWFQFCSRMGPSICGQGQVPQQWFCHGHLIDFALGCTDQPLCKSVHFCGEFFFLAPHNDICR